MMGPRTEKILGRLLAEEREDAEECRVCRVLHDSTPTSFWCMQSVVFICEARVFSVECMVRRFAIGAPEVRERVVAAAFQSPAWAP